MELCKGCVLNLCLAAADITELYPTLWCRFNINIHNSVFGVNTEQKSVTGEVACDLSNNDYRNSKCLQFN